MRPAGEVRVALLKAARDLATDERGATLREIAERACVGLDAARRTMDNMRRTGVIATRGHRLVSYRNRPVAEYVPAELCPTPARVVNVIQAWAR